ncbi:Aste57867_7570 [Aphanomyces stellatus]|uniref:Conserved oligomeric Golgi complex subunit 4 n=1 Tax=Aphanomyces stellatus TaxID=120398 RepID=A0A485KIJ1_9STRA|nr:hypothetical protein As57867_007544 [Aphanomyces stellatus]VFT84479.1 Aste57867_7570 [Aphanomyces stellatus]
MAVDKLQQQRDALAAATAREASIRSSLDEYATLNATQPEGESEREKLWSATQTLLQYKQDGGIAALRRQTAQVGSAIASANDVAEKMTRDVRKLGKIQERLKACVERSDGMMRVRQSLQRLKASMAAKDYKEAAACLKELRDIEAMRIPLDVSDTLRMNNAESDIRYAIESQMETALRNRDEAAVLRVGAIFEPMQFAEEGVQMVLKFITAQLEEKLAHGGGESSTAVWSVQELTGQLIQVFNAVASSTQRYEALMLQSFQSVHGPERMLQALYALGTPAAVRILTAYGKQRGLADLLAKAKASSKPAVASSSQAAVAPPSPSSAKDVPAEPMDLNPFLNELALLMQHSQTYERFMRAREAHYASSPASASTPTWLPAYNASGLNHAVHDLAGYYCSLEEQCLASAARKAFALEEMRSVVVVDDQLIPVSSVVDEIFYVARNSGCRALATGHVDSACGVLNVLASLVQSTLGDAFKARVAQKEGGAASALGLLTTTLNPKQLRDQMQQQLHATLGKKVAATATPPTSNPRVASNTAMVVLAPPVTMNSLDTSVQYLGQLQTTFESEMMAAFPDQPPRLAASLVGTPTHVHHRKSQTKPRVGLEETASEFKALLMTCHDSVCQAFAPKLTATCAPLFKKVSYELTDALFTANEANDPYVHALLHSVKAFLEPYDKHLARANLVTLAEGVADTVVDVVEALVVTKQFNQLGAMQLEKEVRLLGGYFGDKCQHSKRHHETFAFLRQAVMVLNVDAPDDVREFVGRPSKGVEWKLPTQRVIDLLHLRVEFSTATVVAVKL